MIVRAGMFRGRRAQRPLYVDSVNGSDANQGKSPSDALRSIAAVIPKIKAGSTVALARGSHWRESLIVPTAGVRIEAYGTGARPVLDCSDAIAAAAWAKTAGRTSVYEAPGTLDGTDGSQFVSVWENGVRLARASSLDDCDATAGSYCPTSDSNATITLYVHASDGSDPRSNGKTYEYSSRRRGLTATGATSVTGIQTCRNLHCDGSLAIYGRAVLDDCVASEGSRHNVYIGPGSILTDVEADRAYYTGDAYLFVYNGASATGAPVTFVNCYAHDYTGPTAAGFGGHSNDGSAFGTITFHSCRVENCTRDFSVGDAQAVQAINCSSSNPSPEPNNGALYTTCPSVLVDGCTLAANSATGRAVQVDWSGAPAYSVTVRNSTLSGSMAILSGQSNLALGLENNTIDTTGFAVYLSGSGVSLASSGNTFQVPQGQNYYYIAQAGFSVGSDYNTFVQPAGNQFEMPDGTRYDLASWKASGRDIHSTP